MIAIFAFYLFATLTIASAVFADRDEVRAVAPDEIDALGRC